MVWQKNRFLSRTEIVFKFLSQLNPIIFILFGRTVNSFEFGVCCFSLLTLWNANLRWQTCYLDCVCAAKTILFFLFGFAASAIASNSKHTNARRTWENPNGNNNNVDDREQRHTNTRSSRIHVRSKSVRPSCHTTKYTIFPLWPFVGFYDYFASSSTPFAPFAFEHKIINERSPPK